MRKPQSSKAKAASSTLRKLLKTGEQLHRENLERISAEERRREMKERIDYLESELDDRFAIIRQQASEISHLFAVLGSVRAALRQNPPSIALALARLDEELD